MTPNESPALHTNDEPQRILLEASERIKACYPDGTRVEVQFPEVQFLRAARAMVGEVFYVGNGEFVFREDGSPYRLKFSPAVHPHRVLP